MMLARTPDAHLLVYGISDTSSDNGSRHEAQPKPDVGQTTDASAEVIDIRKELCRELVSRIANTKRKRHVRGKVVNIR